MSSICAHYYQMTLLKELSNQKKCITIKIIILNSMKYYYLKWKWRVIIAVNFQASSFQLLKLENLLWWSLFTFIYNRNTIWVSYIFRIISLDRKMWIQQIDLPPNVWLHSSVGWASHRYHGGHGFESCWSPDIFQASSFQLVKLENLLGWSLFTFIYNRSTIWIWN